MGCTPYVWRSDLPNLYQSAHSGMWFAEIVATFGLVLTIFGTLRWKAEAVPLTVGLYITSAYWFTASTSFANLP
jgi:glycerol uptake facilitator-like aquaporin